MTRERVINMIDCILGDNILCDCIEDSTIGCNECRREAADIAINALKKQKTGHWNLNFSLGWIEDKNIWKCSECGYSTQTDIYTNLKWKYCPNCGAYMRGEEE